MKPKKKYFSRNRSFFSSLFTYLCGSFFHTRILDQWTYSLVSKVQSTVTFVIWKNGKPSGMIETTAKKQIYHEEIIYKLQEGKKSKSIDCDSDVTVIKINNYEREQTEWKIRYTQ